MNTNTAEAPVVAEISSRFPDVDLADGEIYAGLSRDPDTGSWHHLVLLPGFLAEASQTAQLEAAKAIGGDLPTRFESPILFANCRDQFDADEAYWTSSQYAGNDGSAWCQYFDGGGQYDAH